MFVRAGAAVLAGGLLGASTARPPTSVRFDRPAGRLTAVFESLLSDRTVLVDSTAATINRAVTVHPSPLLRSRRDVRGEEEDYAAVVHIRRWSACGVFGRWPRSLINTVFMHGSWRAFSAGVLVFYAGGAFAYVRMLVTRSSDVRRRRPMDAAGRTEGGGCVSGQLLRLHGPPVGFAPHSLFRCFSRLYLALFGAPIRSRRDFRSLLRLQWPARSVHSLTSAARHISDWQ